MSSIWVSSGEDDDVIYKTKEINFRGRKKRIILQNENGPCPLIAICNVLILRDDLHPHFREVSEERLLTLVATTLFDFNIDVDWKCTEKQQKKISNAIELLPSIADGINVDIKFKRIDGFVFTPELAIFYLLNIRLYHGWIVNPRDRETVSAIGSKSYNALMIALVALETRTVKSPSVHCSLLRKGDMEEELALFQALRISEREAPGFIVQNGNDMSKGDSLVNSLDDAAGSNICKESKSDDQFSSVETKDERDCDAGNKINVGEVVVSSGALDHDQLSSNECRDETVCEAETEISSKMTTFEKISVEKTNLDSGLTLKSEDSSGRFQGNNDEPPYKGGSLGSPFNKGESLLGKSSLKERDTNELTPEEGELIKKFLNDNRSQLTVTGLSYLQEQVKENKLCVFFRNNHFLTMTKYNGELYQLVTDQGYLTQRGLVWEKLNKVNGDSVFMTGDFKVFKSEEGKSHKWDQKHAISNTADYIFNINNSSSEEGIAIDPDLEMAMMLQQQELAGDIYAEVSRRSNQRPSSMQEEVKVVQRWLMYNHVHKPSSCPFTTAVYIFHFIFFESNVYFLSIIPYVNCLFEIASMYIYFSEYLLQQNHK